MKKETWVFEPLHPDQMLVVISETPIVLGRDKNGNVTRRSK